MALDSSTEGIFENWIKLNTVILHGNIWYGMFHDDFHTGSILISVIPLRDWAWVHANTHTHTRPLNMGFLPDAIVENEITMYIQ